MQADDFFNAYLVLKENNEAFIERQADSSGKLSEGIKIDGVRYTGCIEIICLAFSVELYIKDLHYAINGEVPRGHKILDLFKELPENIQQEIFAYDAISQNPFHTRGDIFSTKRVSGGYSAFDGFIDQIKSISDGFTKWRYSYESAALRYDISFALALVESIKLVTRSVRKNTNKRKE